MSLRSVANSVLIDWLKLDNLPANTIDELANKVDKVAWKWLSQEDYTTTEKNKLSLIEPNANNYILPTSSTITKWWVKIDWITITIDWDWVISSVSWWSWDMTKAVYDTTNNWIVDNSEKLNNQSASYYLDRTNHTWSQAISTVTWLQTAIDWKEPTITTLPIAKWWTNATSQTAPASWIMPIAYFDWTKITTDTTPSHLWYEESTDTVHTSHINIKSATTSDTAKITSTATSSSTSWALLNLYSDDWNAMASWDRLGAISFWWAVDNAWTLKNGWLIAWFTTEAWSSIANWLKLVFSIIKNWTTIKVPVMTINQDESTTFSWTITASNLSWTNTWDNATNSQYSWLTTSKQDTLVSWTNIKTINWTSVLWSWDIVISWWGSNPIYRTFIWWEIFTWIVWRYVSKWTQTITWVKIGTSTLPVWSNIEVQILKNWTATVNSIFTSDSPISILTTESATNWIYTVSKTTIDNWSLVENDILYIDVKLVWSTISWTDLEVIIF